MSQAASETNLIALLRTAPDEDIAQALTDNFDWLTALPPAHVRGDPDQPALPPLAALALFLGARALLRTGRGPKAWPFLEEAVAAYAQAQPRGRRAYVRHTPLSDALGIYDNLRIVAVEALTAAGRWDDAADMLADFTHDVIDRQGASAFTSEYLGELTALADGHRLGPTWHDPTWLISQQRGLISSGALDESKSPTWKVYADYLLCALSAGATEEALEFVEAKAETAWAIEDVNDYGFNAVCVLAHAGRLEQAAAAARDLVRRGYSLLWRFNRASAEEMWWTKQSGQLEWLAPLEGFPAFEALRARYLQGRKNPDDGPQPGPFRSLELTTLCGRSRKRCALSRKLIEPGEPIYRFRPYFHSGDDPPLAAKAAFEASEFALWRDRHLSDGYAPADFAPRNPVDRRMNFGAPAASAFLFDLCEGTPFDVDAFIEVIAAPKVFPMRHEWVRGEFNYLSEPQDGFRVNDDHAGDYVDLTWIMLRCGQGPAIFSRLREIDPAIADPVFAMLATFARPDCRAAAAAHFGLEALPEIMDLVFQSRLSLDDILGLAAFGRANPRFAAAMARALATYNLHIYSNYRPQVDWYLEDLQHYSLAKACRLVFFFIHVPERLPVLATMLEKRWLVSGVGAGAYDGYSNSGHSFYQAAAVNRLLHAPDELAFWLEAPWLARYVRGPTLRETKRMAEAHRKQSAKASRRS